VERERGVTTIADILAPNRVGLDLAAQNHGDAIEKVIALLRGESRVLDWEELHDQLIKSIPCLAEEETEFGICIPHARTDAVTGMVMSAGRFQTAVSFPRCARPIRYIYCIAVPVTLASDYLRIVGLLARTQRTGPVELRLRDATTAAEFVGVLADVEAHDALT
jgi:PTS system nitrogen regulatory IIA component